jgi:Holliday junction resolvase RusA-like endonuclease
VEIFLPGSCVPKGRPRVTRNKKTGKVFAYTPKRTRKYSDAARKVAKNALKGKKPIPGEEGVVMTVEFFRRGKPPKRPDIVNLLSTIADALQTVAYDDDSQIVEVHAYKRKAKIPMTRVEIKKQD